MKRIAFFALCLLLFAGCQATPPTASPVPSTSPVPSATSNQTPAKSETPAKTDAPSPPLLRPEEYPVVDGSTATIPLSLALAKQATGETNEDVLAMMTAHSGTASSYESLLSGNAKLLLAYALPEDTQAFVDQANTKLIMTPIGRDALVFLINTSNPVKNLSTEQIRNIYTGAISNWNKVGGADMPILAFQRNSDSGSQALMKKLVMRDTPMADPPSDKKIEAMGGLVDTIARYANSANAIGYSVYYYVKNMYIQPEITLLSIDGVAPDNDTIRSGAYPFVNDFYAVIREDAPANSPERKLFDYITSADAKPLIDGAGYVSN